MIITRYVDTRIDNNNTAIKQFFANQDEQDQFLRDHLYYQEISDSAKPIYLDSSGLAHQKIDYTLDNLPIPCIAVIEGIEYEIYEQPQFQFSVPGKYVIHIKSSKEYLEKSFVYDYFPSESEL